MKNMENIIVKLLGGVATSVVASIFIKMCTFFAERLKYNERKWIVREKEQNYFLDEQMNFFIFQFIKNTMYPWALIMFNFYVALFIYFYKDNTGGQWADIIVLVLLLVMYSIYFSLKNVQINIGSKNYSYVKLMILGIIVGFIIEICIAPVANTEKGFIVYNFMCVVVTLVQIIVNEKGLNDAGIYETCSCNNYKLFMIMKEGLMCLEAVSILLSLVCDYIKIFEVMACGCITCMPILLAIELIVLHCGQHKPFEKTVYLKDGTFKTTFSGIKEGKNNTIEWKDGSYTTNAKKNNIIKITYFNNFNPQEVKTREITLIDGTKVSGYRYRSCHEWNGICSRRNGGLEIELYPEAMVNMKQDENW